MTDDNVVNFPSDPSDVGRAILQITNDLTRIATQVGKFVDMQKQINEKFDRQMKDVCDRVDFESGRIDRIMGEVEPIKVAIDHIAPKRYDQD